MAGGEKNFQYVKRVKKPAREIPTSPEGRKTGSDFGKALQ